MWSWVEELISDASSPSISTAIDGSVEPIGLIEIKAPKSVKPTRVLDQSGLPLPMLEA